MEDVEIARAPAKSKRVPGRVTNDARKPARAAEREELELETWTAAQRAEEPAHVPCSSGTGLLERRDVNAYLHAATPSNRAACRTASFGSG